MAAAAVLALAGSLALVAGPLVPIEEPLSPASQARTVDDVATVTGHMVFGTTTPGERKVDGEIESERGGSMPGTMVVDDDLLYGTALVEWSADRFGPDETLAESPAAVYTGQLTVENDFGKWAGPWHGVTFPRDAESGRDQTTRHLAIMTGSGAYEGWSALVYVYYPPRASTPEVEGLIFPGELPESPASQLRRRP